MFSPPVDLPLAGQRCERRGTQSSSQNRFAAQKPHRKKNNAPLRFCFSFLTCLCFSSNSRQIRQLRPLRPPQAPHHHHQTGRRAAHFHRLVPGLGHKDVGHGPPGKNPNPLLSIRLQALFLPVRLSLTCLALPVFIFLLF